MVVCRVDLVGGVRQWLSAVAAHLSRQKSAVAVLAVVTAAIVSRSALADNVPVATVICQVSAGICGNMELSHSWSGTYKGSSASEPAGLVCYDPWLNYLGGSFSIQVSSVNGEARPYYPYAYARLNGSNASNAQQLNIPIVLVDYGTYYEGTCGVYRGAVAVIAAGGNPSYGYWSQSSLIRLRFVKGSDHVNLSCDAGGSWDVYYCGNISTDLCFALNGSMTANPGKISEALMIIAPTSPTVVLNNFASTSIIRLSNVQGTINNNSPTSQPTTGPSSRPTTEPAPDTADFQKSFKTMFDKKFPKFKDHFDPTKGLEEPGMGLEIPYLDRGITMPLVLATRVDANNLGGISGKMLGIRDQVSSFTRPVCLFWLYVTFLECVYGTLRTW